MPILTLEDCFPSSSTTKARPKPMSMRKRRKIGKHAPSNLPLPTQVNADIGAIRAAASPPNHGQPMW